MHHVPFTFDCFLMPLEVLSLLFLTQIHATLPRLILHLHDDDLSVRLACRVYNHYVPLTSYLHELAYVTICCFAKTEHISAPCPIDGSRWFVFAPQQAVFYFGSPVCFEFS